jgi:hypothetical protein
MAKKLVLSDMSNCKEKEWNNWYWGDYNTICKSCNKTCKQSWKVKVVCKQFDKIKEEGLNEN